MISSWLPSYSKPASSDLYNIHNYTDEELFRLLDLTNPSDKILEAKILTMINKYRYLSNEKSQQLTTFFQQMYTHFFPDSDSDEDSDSGLKSNKAETVGFAITNTNYADSDEDSDKDTDTEIIKEAFTNPEDYLNLDGNLPNIKSLTNEVRNTGAPSSANNPFLNPRNSNILTDVPEYTPTPTEKKIYSKFNIDNAVNTVTQVGYKKDNLNPILKQTIKRVINIDSSKRDTKKYPNTTSFSFNLSEPLRDVLSLKMYSIHLPYTWFTVNSDYGGNFFYLKGNAPGIDLGNVDLKIEINSGNYINESLVRTVNESIQNLKTNNPDISFGTTVLTYDSTSVKTTFTVDITYLFNEMNYQFQFSKWSKPTDDDTRYTESVAAYLGFNYQTYTLGDVYSYPRLPLISSTPINDSESIYEIKSTNSKVYLLEVQLNQIPTKANPTDAAIDSFIQDNASSILKTFDLGLSYGIYTRTNIKNAFTTLLASYENSTLEQINATEDRLGFGNSYYKIHMNVSNRKNIPGLKYLLVFPQEDPPTALNPSIWVGDGNSCFCFKKRVHVLSDILAETESLQSNYVLPQSPYIELKCITDGYKDNIINNFQITIPSTTETETGNYTFDQYLLAINNAITTQHTSIITSNSKAICDDTTDNKLQIYIDLNIRFVSSDYHIYFSDADFNSIFLSIFNLTPSIDNKIPTNGFSSTINSVAAFSIPANSILFKVYPVSNGNNGVSPFIVKTSDTSFSGNRTDTMNSIQNNIRNYYDLSTNTYPFANSSFTILQNGSGFDIKLTIEVSLTLTENNYQIIFQDPNAGTIENSTMTNWTSNNTWKNDWKILDQSYNLKDYASGNGAIITANDAVSGYELELKESEQITLYAFAPGVYSPGDENSITLTVPAATYTRSQLLTGLNTQLAINPKTVGSEFFITTEPNGFQYVQCRLNINKIYTTNDFNLVFYDPFSFVKCFTIADQKRLGQGAQNTTWDSTLGWMLGFRKETQYNLSKISSISNIKTLTGDTVTSVYLYNYFLLVIDDYGQSQINDGLVSINTGENAPNVPPRRNNVNYSCDPATQQIIYNPTPSETQKQIYAQSVRNRANIIEDKNYLSKPFIKNIFGIIPVKLSGLGIGSIYTEFGGTLQNQERVYFGPVNIYKMKIQLINDRGEVVDLNGAEWSFSLICEQLYRQ